MTNIKRSVERVAGVKNVAFNLETARATVAFDPDTSVSPADLWQAVKESGFTPVRVETGGVAYEGPQEGRVEG